MENFNLDDAIQPSTTRQQTEDHPSGRTLNISTRSFLILCQQYCNRSHNGKTFTDLYNDIHDLIKYNSDGVKSSTRDSDTEI